MLACPNECLGQTIPDAVELWAGYTGGKDERGDGERRSDWKTIMSVVKKVASEA